MSTKWKPKPGDKVIRHPREEQIRPISLKLSSRKVNSKVFASPLLLIYLFATLIFSGTILLILPISNVKSEVTPFIDALYTATSAVTVTGLILHDTGQYWSTFCQAVILFMIFTGGLGFMSLATFLLVLVGQKVTLSQKLLVRESITSDNSLQIGGLVQITIRIVILAVFIQFIGFLLLLLKYSLDYSLQEASWLAIFHSVSGFNNAGFILFSETDINSHLKNDYYFTWIINILSILGSIGFWVIVDIIKIKKFHPLQLTSKIVIFSTFIFIFISSLFFFSSEYNNEKTIGNMNIANKIHHSLFESISGRTAGFSTIDFRETNPSTKFFFSGMMLIGGASGSTASGLKINTVAIIIIAVICTLKGQNRITSFKREISFQLVKKAIVICVPSILILFTLMTILMIFETDYLFINTFFEIHSAFANVGLTTGISGKISPIGDIIVIISMFLGRIVPLAIAFLITIQNEYETFRYPNERITIG